MVNGKCLKDYPKAFQEETSLGEDGYPKYRRPNDGRAYEVRGVTVDNSWVVPHSPLLSAKYNCHINLECCVSFASIKYLHKYIFKGKLLNLIVLH